MDEVNRCLQCKNPQCQKACPINTPIPEVIRLLRENKLDEAGWLLFENNPLTTVCSLICNHENQCEGHCVLGRKSVPVHFSTIEQYVSRTYAPKMVRGPREWNGMRAAIIGSGPAGITIAIILARYGYKVTIFESKNEIGGVLRYGIPDFRLPKAILDDIQYRHIEMKGIRVRPNVNIGGAIGIEDLFRDDVKGGVKEDSPYGLCVYRQTLLLKDRTVYGHQGMSNGMTSVLLFEPESQFVVAILTNGCDTRQDHRLCIIHRKLFAKAWEIFGEEGVK